MSRTEISKPHLFALYLSSVSMFALAAALVYFSIELVGVAKQVPDILKLVEHTSDKIDPVIHEVAEIKAMVPSILLEVEEIRKLVKPAITEYAKTNEQIPRILDEVEAMRQSLPRVLTTVDNISKEVAATRQTVPSVLKTVDDVSDTGRVMAKEVEAVRGLVPDILTEIKTTRESVPQMMAEADKLIDKARVAGKEASQGAVTGIFSGILFAPFSFVGDVGKKLVGISDDKAGLLSEEDFDLVESAVRQLLNSGEVGDEKTWKNENIGSEGRVKLLDISDGDFEEDIAECRELFIHLIHESESVQKKTVTLCQNDSGEWDFE